MFFSIALQYSEESGNSVQFMQFDSNGNLYVYQPGAGCSGTPCKIEQGFSQEELLSCDWKQESPTVVENSKNCVKLPQPMFISWCLVRDVLQLDR